MTASKAKREAKPTPEAIEAAMRFYATACGHAEKVGKVPIGAANRGDVEPRESSDFRPPMTTTGDTPDG